VLHCIRFNLKFQGQTLEVDVGQETTSYRLKDGSGLTIRHEDSEVKLSAETPFAERPNRKRDAGVKQSA
jgi:trehalose/maltose hydrolase-like predicted phosphorylase